jgi:hypothetical protein
MLLSCLIFVSSTALFFYFVVQTLRHLFRHRRTTNLQSGPPSPENGFKTIQKSFLIPKLKWTYLSPYYLRS